MHTRRGGRRHTTYAPPSPPLNGYVLRVQGGVSTSTQALPDNLRGRRHPGLLNNLLRWEIAAQNHIEQALGRG